ncbi:1-propanol dehydrogenase PduQ [Desulfobotulus mexicanus]|uniref:Iron-containing alcohol dehydrogenase n=1 Tax=Desulfobotulus mexicanus TaxID=2586642 RepID=A0A5S5MF49_9BACT|nr:1-propanol dehydrogenase PduQ [Desulfobotulus mexicanus]TYT74307.1 iron-containing alcohol dehydrogenase [Desulfobotulus mexicanus]
MTQFNGRTKICYGSDAIETLEKLPSKRAFIVTDPFMVKTGFADRIKSHLDRAGISHQVFDGVEPDPSLETVTRGTLHLLQSQSDLVIALGGGSAIDAAKAILFFAHKAGQEKEKPMLVAIPTTSGTGSEVTAISVITDTANGVKIPLNDELLIPDMAILDARFTRTVPPGVTAVTGMDVLTHAIEAYTSRQSSAFTTIYSEYAIKYVFRYLFRAYQCGDDMEAREMMLLASCMAGMAFNNSGLGITHSMAHSLGGLFHVPHGRANAVLLPYVIRFNSFDVGVRYREIAEMLGLAAHTVEEGTTSLISAVRSMNESMGIPNRIRDLNIEEHLFRKNLDTMASHAMEDACTKGNPRLPSHGDIRGLLEQAW